MINFILAAYGLTFILVYGKIFEDFRPEKITQKKWNTSFIVLCAWAFGLDVFYFALTSGQNYLHLIIQSPIFLFAVGFLLEHLIYISMLVDDFGFRISKSNFKK